VTAAFRVAAIRASPVFLNRDATLDKACLLIDEGASQGARLIALPESFTPPATMPAQTCSSFASIERPGQ
jgi:predicted amidohydrolase